MFEKQKEISSEFNPDAELVLYQGDVNDFVASLPNNSVQLIITSPPYNLGKEYEDRISIEKYLAKQADLIARVGATLARIFHWWWRWL